MNKVNEGHTYFIILGATGDLASKKIIPSLYHLFIKNRLPRDFSVVAFARREITTDEFREYSKELLKKHKDISSDIRHVNAFLRKIYYHQGHFENVEVFSQLSEYLGKGKNINKLIYLAVPPVYYGKLFNNLKISGLSERDELGWTRILVEKPFGGDFQGSRKLDLLLGKLFKEEQIYRIDHYLAKDMIQNILIFRFSNNIFEPSWNNKYIEKIEINVPESMDVSGRGKFYDGVGALRDVGQNHLLQMLAVVTMENPKSFNSDAIRKKRAEILKYLVVPSRNEVVNNSFRAQYVGYQDIEGVEKGSKVETYFKLVGHLSHPKWRGVPIIFESGKVLSKQYKEIVITFRHPSPCLCQNGHHNSQNKVVLSIDPREEIAISLYTKKPGYSSDVIQKTFPLEHRLRSDKFPQTEEYEKLLMDAINGDQTLFVSTKEVASMWKFTDPFVKAWKKGLVPLNKYSPYSDDILKMSSKIGQ